MCVVGVVGVVCVVRVVCVLWVFFLLLSLLMAWLSIDPHICQSDIQSQL